MTKEQPVLQRKSYTREELQKLKDEIAGDFSQERRLKWLLERGAIRFHFSVNSKNEQIRETIVLQYPDNSILYTELNHLWDSAKYSLGKVAYQQPENNLQFTQSMI